MNKPESRWLEEIIVRMLEHDTACARLRQAIDSLRTGRARAEFFNETFLAMQELWNDIYKNAGELTPLIVLNSYLDRAANRLIDALKRTEAVLIGADKDAMRSAVAEMLQGLLRAAAADHQGSGGQNTHGEESLSSTMMSGRYAFMRYAVRRGKAFSIARIMDAFDLTFAEARQRTRRGRFSDEDIAVLLELPLSAVLSLSTPQPSAAALNQLLKHTGYRDIALQMRHDVTATEGTAVAAQSADNARVPKSDVVQPEIDASFEELEAKYRSSKDSAND